MGKLRVALVINISVATIVVALLALAQANLVPTMFDGPNILKFTSTPTPTPSVTPTPTPNPVVQSPTDYNSLTPNDLSTINYFVNSIMGSGKPFKFNTLGATPVVSQSNSLFGFPAISNSAFRLGIKNNLSYQIPDFPGIFYCK